MLSTEHFLGNKYNGNNVKKIIETICNHCANDESFYKLKQFYKL